MFCCCRVDLRVKNRLENAGICSRHDRFSAVAILLLEMELKQRDILAERHFFTPEIAFKFRKSVDFW